MSDSLKIARTVVTAVASITALAGAAAAQEFCIVCTTPQAMYRCAIDNYRPGTAPNLGVVCTDAMARTGGHASCTVGKGITVLDCKGPLMRVDIINPATPVVTNAAVEDAKAAKAKAESGEPKTVLDMIKRAQSPATAPAAPAPQPAPAAPSVKRSDQPAPTASPAPRPAADKSNPLADTWRCMWSFFTKCGD